MSSVSLPNFSVQSLNRSGADRLLAPQKDLLHQTEFDQQTETARLLELPSPESNQAAVSAAPSSLDMRFEFNAVNKAWMLTITDSGSGDVVRKIAIAAFSGSNSAVLHRSAIWIDKAV